MALYSNGIGVFGSGGFGRDVMPLAKQHASDQNVVFVQDHVDAGIDRVNGISLISFEEFASAKYCGWRAAIAVADSRVRRAVATRLENIGRGPVSLRAKSAIVFDTAEIGEGAILCDNTMHLANVKIGRFFHSNIYSYVEHDCVIGDFVTFAPAVRCNGTIHIEDDVYVGSGAIIKQGRNSAPLTLGRGSVIGMGAVVTKDVLPGEVVVGNPARPLRR